MTWWLRLRCCLSNEGFKMKFFFVCLNEHGNSFKICNYLCERCSKRQRNRGLACVGHSLHAHSGPCWATAKARSYKLNADLLCGTWVSATGSQDLRLVESGVRSWGWELHSDFFPCGATVVFSQINAYSHSCFNCFFKLSRDIRHRKIGKDVFQLKGLRCYFKNTLLFPSKHRRRSKEYHNRTAT